MAQLSLHTPLGAMTLFEEDGAIVALEWGWGANQTKTTLLTAARDQLHAYFDGSRRGFDLKLAPATGTLYQHRVWNVLITIPFGTTVTYADIARQVGGSPRSVGGANGANPIPIIIPCHRVVASGGIGGYSGDGGVDTKRWLLRREGAALGNERPVRTPDTAQHHLGL